MKWITCNDGYSKKRWTLRKKSKGNAKGQKQCDKNKKRINELEYMLLEMTQIEMQREEKEGISKNFEIITKDITCT